MAEDLELDWDCPEELKMVLEVKWVTMEYLNLPSKKLIKKPQYFYSLH